MTKRILIASISGIRGVFGAGLGPRELVEYAAAYALWCKEQQGSRPLVVIGRDARTTGDICSRIVAGTLSAAGIDVIDAGLSSTPTVEMAVIKEGAVGGIVLSASHNPGEWNALKLLNGAGEFLSPDEGARVLALATDGLDPTVGFEAIGTIGESDYLPYHIDQILGLPFIDRGEIAERGFRVVVDGINSVGGLAIPALLARLGLGEEQIIRLNCEPTGLFAHPAEPLPANLTETIRAVADSGADLGIVVDPDADRLALIEGGGRYMSEELTQVVAADFMWRFRPGPFATNLSSSRAIEDVAARHGQKVYRSAVGEINVVRKMQEVGAVLGGEGNGGVILPDLHYGRDALVGTAMVLQHLANERCSLTDVREGLPSYHIAKKKTAIGAVDPDVLLASLATAHEAERVDTTDGVKIDMESSWVHVRRSNTEPIVRVYAEAPSAHEAEELGDRLVAEVDVLAAALDS
jgi:phosphomannomutase